MIKSCEQNWRIYTETWRAETREEKIRLFQQSLVADCRYTDPLSQIEGWDALLAYMDDFHRQIPGGHYGSTGKLLSMTGFFEQH